jgi:hypothetical protein
MRNPPEEWDSAENNQLIVADSHRQDPNIRKILQIVQQFQDQKLQILYTTKINYFKNLNMETSLKLKTN